MEPLVAFLIGKFASAAAGEAAGRAEGLLRDLLGLQDAQSEMLARIEGKVDALLTGPMNAGLRHLGDALDPWREHDDKQRLLWAAHGCLVEALGQDTDHLRRSFAALHLSATWLALDKHRDAFDALREAHREAGEAALDVPTPRFAPPVWARAEVLPYFNALAEARRAWGDPPSAAPRFIASEKQSIDDPRVTNTWETWAAAYAWTRHEGRKTPSEDFVQQAIRLGVDDVERLRAAMEEVDKGALLHAQYLDDWITAELQR